MYNSQNPLDEAYRSLYNQRMTSPALAPEALFFDLEVVPAGPEAGKVFRWAALQGDELHQGKDVMGLFERARHAPYLCAHNLLGHDARFLPRHPETDDWLAPGQQALDTLYLSSL